MMTETTIETEHQHWDEDGQFVHCELSEDDCPICRAEADFINRAYDARASYEAEVRARR